MKNLKLNDQINALHATDINFRRARRLLLFGKENFKDKFARLNQFLATKFKEKTSTKNKPIL